MIDADALHGDVHAQLLAQIPHTRVLGGIPSMLDLEVDSSVPASSCPDGLLPVQGVAEEPDGTPLGLVFAWVSHGYIAALESAWVTDEPPTRSFSPDHLRIEPSSR